MRSRSTRVTGALAAVALAVLTPAACSDDDGGDGDTEALCALVGDGRGYATLFEDGFDPTNRRAALDQLRAATVDLGELRRVAPSSLRSEIDDEVRYLEALREALETAGTDDPAAVVAAVNALDDERAQAEVAALRLAAFEDEHCDRAPTPTPTTDAAGDP